MVTPTSSPASTRRLFIEVSGIAVQVSSCGNDAIKERRVTSIGVTDFEIWKAEFNCDTKLRTVFRIHSLCSGSVAGLANTFPVFLSIQPYAVFWVLNDGTMPFTSKMTRRVPLAVDANIS